ncbi:MAG TPA: FmdB family transcriptional regulator [Candidatus Accumulibacter sp.]|nr:FmdB family transcriptional regulator [Accumulibacter sp.]
MPIYAYRCDSCAFEKDHLQKLSDPALCICPQCGQTTYRKQVTAAGFQLKGTGWYATDFKGGNKTPATAPAQPEDAGKAPANAGAAPAAAPTTTAPAAASGSTPGVGAGS